MLRSFYRPHARVTFKNEIVHPWTGEITNPPSMTKQEFKRECDINNIIKSYSTTGMLNHVSAKAAMGAYLDLPDDLDFQTSIAVVEQAEQAFMTLPSSLRARFDNEPAKFLNFVADPANKEELYTLGLAQRPIPTQSSTTQSSESSDQSSSS